MTQANFGSIQAAGTDTTTYTCGECGKQLAEDKCPEHPAAARLFDSTTPIQVRTMRGLVNPFRFDALESHPLALTDRDVLNYLCGETPDSIPDFVTRYRETNIAAITIVPDIPQFTGKIIAPLKDALRNYMTGGWIGAVSTCGIACESLTILLFEGFKHNQINGKALGDIQKSLFGERWDRISQFQRLQLLRNIGLISEPIFKDLEEVRDTRNKYTHFFNTDMETRDAKEDARRLLELTARATLALVIMDFNDGALVLQPWLDRYLFGDR